MTITATKVKAGRTYRVNANGAEDVSVKYQLVLSAPLGADELPTSFGADVPKIGEAHPARPGFYVTGYEVSQPADAGKSTLDVTVKYGPIDYTWSSGENPEIIEAVQEWGWDDGTGDKELVTSVAVGEDAMRPVLNSAGDPFDSVPTVNVPTPTFTKVVRTKARKSGYTAYNCVTNSTQVTIGDMVCAPGTLLCTVAERKLIGEQKLPYEYAVHLRYRSNIVPAEETGQESEVGWDAAVVDAGMRELDSTTNEPKLIQVISHETGKPATVTSPALLDGHGHAVTAGSGGTRTPHTLVFHAYKRMEFPAWFYSEPATPGSSSNASSSSSSSGGSGGSSGGSVITNGGSTSGGGN